ncbi:MAG: AbrB/MazE/SpoVT family DNA-binding domain-containing protein [Armatimonadota bacterium]
MNPEQLQEDFMGAVTVGERGQVVIPAEARKRMGLEPGDKLLAFLHPGEQGIFLARVDMLDVLSGMLSKLQTLAEAEDEDDTPGSDE